MMNPASAAAAAAAAVAAQINAAIAAQQRLMAPPKPEKTYFEEDVDINHSKNKHILTKGSTHNQIHSLTGAVISARGRYKALGDCSNNDPLHLHVSADSEEKVQAAVERIHKIMGPNPLKAHMASSVCTVGFEPTVGFDALAEIQGPEGEFLNHIKLETSIESILIRGRGALPPHNESSEPLHVYIGGLNASAVNAAKELVDNLLETVRAKYRQFCAQRDACAPGLNHGGQPFAGYSTPAAAFCPPPAYPPPDAHGDMMNVNQHAGYPQGSGGFIGRHGWSEQSGAAWVDPGLCGTWGDGGTWGDAARGASVGWAQAGRRGAAGVTRAWGGGMIGPTVGFGSKASYKSVGPPPSIAYEHRMVMAEEAAANPYAMPALPSSVSGARQRADGDVDCAADGDAACRRDGESVDRRREGDYIKGDTGERDEGRERRRSFREEPGDRDSDRSRDPVRERRSFREAGPGEASQPGSRQSGSGGREELPAADRPDAAPRKRRFVEAYPEEPPPPPSRAAPDQAHADAMGRAAREAAAAGAGQGGAGERQSNKDAAGKDAAGPRLPPRKLPPVPTFGSAVGGAKAVGSGAVADVGLIAAGKANGSGTGERPGKTSDAMSLLLDEYDEDDS